MQRSGSGKSSFWRRQLYVGAIAALLTLPGQAARADEGGVSFWVPGLFGSLAAVPTTPGWTLAEVYYHTMVHAFGSVARAREITIGRFPATVNVNFNAGLNAQADLMFLSPTYTFATPVLGGQLAMGVTGIVGRNAVNIGGTLTTGIGPLAVTRSGLISDSIFSVGDLYPMITLKWHDGVHNWMTYATGDIPVGAYDPNRLANIGIGHGAIDAGAGYTYLNPVTGHEFSGVGGFTYNFKNQDTQYQNGIDFHFDWGASQFLSKEVFVGLVGYVYQQVTADSGQHPILGPFKSRGNRGRPAGRAWRHEGVFERQGLWRIRPGKPASGLEYLGDVCDFSGAASKHRDADPTHGDEMRVDLT